VGKSSLKVFAQWIEMMRASSTTKDITHNERLAMPEQNCCHSTYLWQLDKVLQVSKGMVEKDEQRNGAMALC